MQVLDQVSEEELLVLLQEGNHAAYAEIYNRYSRLLYMHAYRKLTDRELAKDLIQDLFTTLWVKRQEINIKISLSAYLYTTLRNRILNHFSHKNITSAYLSFVEQYPVPENDLTDHLIRHKQLMEMIEHEINQLPEKMRQVFELSRKKHLTHKEIAVELSISEQTVRKQIQNALRIMRPKLGSLIIFYFLT